MKILEIDYDYYSYPQGINCIEDFITYLNEHYNAFIELTCFDTENCVFPYLISNEAKQVYINTANIPRVSEVEVTLLTRADYDARLEKVVKKKCIDCVNYKEDNECDNLNGHRNKLSLDGECFLYERKK